MQSKIARIRDGLDTQTVSQLPSVAARPLSSHLTEFTLVTSADVLQLIHKSASKSCGLDPIPTSLLKEHAVTPAPTITNIVNLSLLTGEVPAEIKQAVVTPLLKKSSLDPNILKNYRPVSNLSYISKLMEKVVAIQLSQHLLNNNLYEPYQSAYITCHSTQTALTRVSNDILQALDSKQSLMLVLLDMSAAFDTIDHTILLNMHEVRYGIAGTAHQWFRSYLSDRSQRVRILGKSSDSRPLNLGVPQGSVLGPVIFTLYSAQIASIARRHGLSVHLYADDTQLYISLSSDEAAVIVARVECCLAEINAWLVAHKLKLNDDKTVIVEIRSPRSVSALGDIMVGQERITLSEATRNLGVFFDRHFNLQNHVQKLCRSAYAQLRNIAQVRSVLLQKAAETLVHAFVTSRLDYCNALMYGLPACTISKLQRLQNSAPGVVTRSRKFDHITPILRDLHWLPVSKRITFKVLILTYRALHGLAPDYIADLVMPYSPVRSLLSANERLFTVPASRLRSLGDRRFPYAAPSLWNGLPLTVCTAETLSKFKSLLKTYLFIYAFRNELL